MQKFEHGGDLKKIMAQENVDKIIDFSANINPYGLSKNIKKAIVDHIDDIIHYPEPDARDRSISGTSFARISSSDLFSSSQVPPRDTQAIISTFSFFSISSTVCFTEIGRAHV